MQISALGQSRRRTLAVSVLLFLVTGLLSATALPLWLVNDNLQMRVDDLTARLARYESIAKQDRQLRQHYMRLTRARSSSGQLLKSESEAVAAAEIQRALGAIADSNRAELMSTQILPSAELDKEGLRPVGLRVRMRGTLPDLVKTIYELESNSMLLFLEEFSMRVGSNRRVGNQQSARHFETSFDVIGYMSVLQ